MMFQIVAIWIEFVFWTNIFENLSNDEWNVWISKWRSFFMWNGEIKRTFNIVVFGWTLIFIRRPLGVRTLTAFAFMFTLAVTIDAMSRQIYMSRYTLRTKNESRRWNHRFILYGWKWRILLYEFGYFFDLIPSKIQVATAMLKSTALRINK